MNTTLEAIPELPGPEYVKLNEIQPPHSHWFYQKRSRDGELDKYGQPKEHPVFACQEIEAASLDPNQFKQIGYSDGKTYFNYMREHFKPNMLYKVEDAVRVEKEAFAAELEVARGHFRKPKRQDHYFGGASQGTTGKEEFLSNWLGK